VHCAVSDFTGWSACDKSCGDGVQFRTRSVITAPQHNGFACPYLKQGRACNHHHCPVDCEVSSWVGWSSCSISCVDTTAYRLGGAMAEGDGKADTKVASTHPTRTWFPTTAPTQSPTWKHVESLPHRRLEGITEAHGDKYVSQDAAGATHNTALKWSASAPGESIVRVHSADWNGQHTHAHDDYASAWGHDDSTYDGTVGAHFGGYKYDTRTITQQPTAGGKPCPVLYKTMECTGTGPCPIHCEMSDWTPLSACTKSCRGLDLDGQVRSGTQYQTRTIQVKDQHGGEVCGDTKYTTECNTFDCPIDCIQTKWSDWEPCSASCAGGPLTQDKPVQRRTRTIDVDPAHGGVACGAPEETRYCNEQRCPIDCVVGLFDIWSACSSQDNLIGGVVSGKCGYGTRHTKREITVDVEFGGKPCPVLTKEEVCYDGPCSRDCNVTEFSSFSECTKTCVDPSTPTEVGTKRRTRSIIEAAFMNGAVCPDLENVVECNNFFCPVDCEVGAWSTWEPTIHDANKLIRQRSVTSPAGLVEGQTMYGGKPCPHLREEKVMPCVDHHRFGTWSSCSKKCGTGKKWRHRNHVYCSEKAALKYDIDFLQGVDCNMHACADEADRYITTVPTIPALEDVQTNADHHVSAEPTTGVNDQTGYNNAAETTAADQNIATATAGADNIDTNQHDQPQHARRLNDNAGAWRTLNAAEQAAYELPAGEWKMFEKF